MKMVQHIQVNYGLPILILTCFLQQITNTKTLRLGKGIGIATNVKREQGTFNFGAFNIINFVSISCQEL